MAPAALSARPRGLTTETLTPIMVGELLQFTGSWLAPMLAAAVIALIGAAIYGFMLSDDTRHAVAEPAAVRELAA